MATVLVALGLLFHPVPAGGFEERRPSVLQHTPWWGPIHVAIAAGSATGLYFLEPLIFANVPAFLWLGYAGLTIARAARAELAAGG